ncbi:MAG TPA: SpoIIE family protein phosphatase, partial [Streptosporangiaceae bacterium]|nr:SpoIIE family protein phosphatase [Streptosporangiaceae bacterium]
MTSGMSAKGSALGASAPGSGVPPKRAPAPRAPVSAGNGARRGHAATNGTDSREVGIGETEETFAGSIGAESVPPALFESVRTLILGIDYDGRIVQYDRNAPRILAREPDELLGAQLSDLTVRGAAGNSHAARPVDGVAAVGGLLEAIRSDREGSAMLTIETRDGHPAEAVVTVHPMRAVGTSLAALALLRIPVPRAERFVDPAVMRKQMLDDTFTRIGDTLDIDHLARELIDALVPHFCNAADLLLLESLMGNDELPAHGPEGSLPLRRIALSHDRKDPAWEAAFPTGEILRYPAHTPYYNCMDTAKPVLETISESQANKIAKAWRRKPVAKLLSGASMLLLPLIARGTMLGFFACTRQEGFRRFDAYDIEIGMDFASRAAMFIDNARRYSREHATALTLQRSMLPTGLSYPSSVEVRHRYLPGSKLIEVGGDWYESIALPGGRVALVVGDVAGHGVRAAVTMGRLRTAIH